MSSPESCPNCGADVPRNVRVCPECGSCEETGWSEDAETSHLGLPEDKFDYDEFVEREFGGEKATTRGFKWFWWVIAAIVLILFAVLLFR